MSEDNTETSENSLSEEQKSTLQHNTHKTLAPKAPISSLAKLTKAELTQELLRQGYSDSVFTHLARHEIKEYTGHRACPKCKEMVPDQGQFLHKCEFCGYCSHAAIVSGSCVFCGIKDPVIEVTPQEAFERHFLDANGNITKTVK